MSWKLITITWGLQCSQLRNFWRILPTLSQVGTNNIFDLRYKANVCTRVSWKSEPAVNVAVTPGNQIRWSFHQCLIILFFSCLNVVIFFSISFRLLPCGGYTIQLQLISRQELPYTLNWYLQKHREYLAFSATRAILGCGSPSDLDLLIIKVWTKSKA